MFRILFKMLNLLRLLRILMFRKVVSILKISIFFCIYHFLHLFAKNIIKYLSFSVHFTCNAFLLPNHFLP